MTERHETCWWCGTSDLDVRTYERFVRVECNGCGACGPVESEVRHAWRRWDAAPLVGRRSLVESLRGR